MKALVSTTRKRKAERVFLVGVELKSHGHWEVRDCLTELAELVATAGGEVVGSGLQRLDNPATATFIGRGKADEFARFCHQAAVDTVIFDDELSPAQNRNLERLFDCKVLDRTALILDIFARRARSREGKLQVELAQLQHLLPRLTRFWTHLSRQKGGIGMRGEGETQLETDRRKVQDRIRTIAQQIEEVRRRRGTQRHGRKRLYWPVASIVGYTNAGKSTLLNALTHAGVLAEDKLFATLDPTTRRLRLPTNQNVFLTDTVGFIRKLPHRLVEAFKATLEEVTQSDLLIHVVDISSPQVDTQIQAVESVLAEIGAENKPVLLIFNKTDQVTRPERVEQYLERYPHSVAVSALRQAGFTALLEEIGNRLQPQREYVELAVPHRDAAVIAKLHAVGQVIERRYNGEMAHFKAWVPPHFLPEFQRYRNGASHRVLEFKD